MNDINIAAEAYYECDSVVVSSTMSKWTVTTVLIKDKNVFDLLPGKVDESGRIKRKRVSRPDAKSTVWFALEDESDE